MSKSKIFRLFVCLLWWCFFFMMCRLFVHIWRLESIGEQEAAPQFVPLWKNVISSAVFTCLVTFICAAWITKLCFRKQPEKMAK